ncbi:MAG: hypothetical protein CMB25_05845 [Euryarchaeota archaeon]|nr:hypothetical protein [Euryarchaeota archaeon]
MVVCLDNLELLFEEVWVTDSHFFHLFSVTTCRIQCGRNHNSSGFVSTQIIEKGAQTVTSRDDRDTRNMGMVDFNK